MNARSIITLGGLFGLIFGVWNVLAAVLTPVTEDTPLRLLAFYGPMFTAWGFIGGRVFQRRQRLASAAIAGAMVALVTFAVLTAIVILRVNLTLETIVQRPDWQNMVANYPGSGFDSFRTYVNYIYLSGAPFKIAVASAIGAISGLIGGLIRRGTPGRLLRVSGGES
jgi:hypothetical protein